MSASLRRNALPITLATSVSLFALAATAGCAEAQSANPQLPPIVVQQPNTAAQPSAAAKPKSQPQPQPAKAEVPAKPVKQAAAKKKPAPASAPEPVEAPSASLEPVAAASPATALGSYNPALDLPGLELPPGTTLTTAGPVDGYRALSAMSSTKTATPIERIPQSIQVVPRSVIEDQTSISVDETVRNVSNVQSFNDLNIGNSDMAGAKIRGLKAEIWLDGMVVNYNTGDRDAFANVERIEVLKGPSAILYGGGSGAPAGGAINVISKLPTDRAGGEFGVTFGSHSFARPYFDINQPLTSNGTVLFRITGEYTSADSYVDVLEQDRYSINPTLTLTNKIDTTLTIQARKSRFEQQAYPGLPAVGTVAGNFRIDPHLYVGHPGIPRSYTEVEGVTVTLDHRIDSNWSFNIKSRWSQSGFDQKSQGPVSGTPDGFFGPTNFQLVDVHMFQEQQEFSINPNLQAKFEAGPTSNVLLLGADYSRSTDRGRMDTNFGGYFTGLLPELDVLNPVFTTPYADPDPTSPLFLPFFIFDAVYKTKGVYGQLQSTLYDRIHLLGGLRWANLDVEYQEDALLVPQTFAVDESKVLPRAGVVVDVIPGLSLYASYSEGMRWAGFNQARDVKPEFSESREAGIKFKLANQLSGTVAVFDIERSNMPVVVGGFVAALTDQRSKGFETDLIWQPNRNWQVLANYGYANAEIATGARAGNKLTEVPAHSGRLWVNYAFDPDVLKGWSIGAGVYAASSQFVDIANVYETDGYFTVDAKIGYDSEHFSASLNVKNLTGEDYFVPYAWFGGQVAPGPERGSTAPSPTSTDEKPEAGRVVSRPPSAPRDRFRRSRGVANFEVAMNLTKRELLLAMAAGLAAGATAPQAARAGAEAKGDGALSPEHVHDMSQFPAHWHGSEKIAFLLYPKFTALDLIGPHYMLASLMGAKVWLVAKTLEPIESDLKLAIVPTATFAECPADLDILCVPGGGDGTLAAMRDAETIAFLEDRGARAKYVTSVCTGSMLLGAAGLLDGYKATSHWATREVLRDFGAEPVDERVVVDRSRITGAGVTAGIDFGMTILAKLRDENYAKGVQLLAEYAPAPPFAAGTPQGAGPELTAMMAGMLSGVVQQFRDVAKERRKD